MRCCHAMCLKRLAQHSTVRNALPGKDPRGTAARKKVEGNMTCSDDQPFAALPPRGSREHWVKDWTGYNESLRGKHTAFRKYGRCNDPSNICHFLGPDGKPHIIRVNCSQAPPYLA